MATKSIRVCATKTCFIRGHRRKAEARFFVPAEEFNKNCMEKVGDQVAEVVDGSEAANVIDDMTVAELKAALAKKGISAPASANKKALAELLKGSEGLGDDDGDNDEGGDAGNDGDNGDDLG